MLVYWMKTFVLSTESSIVHMIAVPAKRLPGLYYLQQMHLIAHSALWIRAENFPARLYGPVLMQVIVAFRPVILLFHSKPFAICHSLPVAGSIHFSMTQVASAYSHLHFLIVQGQPLVGSAAFPPGDYFLCAAPADFAKNQFEL